MAAHDQRSQLSSTALCLLKITSLSIAPLKWLLLSLFAHGMCAQDDDNPVMSAREIADTGPMAIVAMTVGIDYHFGICIYTVCPHLLFDD